MPSLKVTYPEGGLVLRQGSYYEIKWENIGAIATNVDIELWVSDTPVKILDIALDQLNNGSYLWKIDWNQDERTDYYIRVETTDNVYADNGSDFEIGTTYQLSDFTDLINLNKVTLVEIKPGIEIPLDGWSLASGGSAGINAYEIAYTGGELVNIQQNGVELTRVYSESECDSTEGSYFHDFFNQFLYAHLNGDIDPSVSGTYLIGFTWLGFTNQQEPDDVKGFIPENSLYPIFYYPYLQMGSIPSVTLTVGEYYRKNPTSSFGGLAFNNDGWWYSNRNNYLWHNKECLVKVGGKGTQYDEYVIIFSGHTRTPQYTDAKVTINLRDKRAGILKNIPSETYNTDDFPDVSEDSLGEVRPILFGIKTGIIPKCIDTTTFEYEISQTSFSAVFPLEAIDNVYLDGVEIFETESWTSNLNAGTITLVNDPGDGVLTVDAQGIQCQYDFLDGTTTGTFTENVADILFFVLVELNNIPVSQLNLDDFDSLQTVRTSRLGWYLNKTTPTNNFITLLQQSSLFRFIPELNGNFTVTVYDRAVPTDTPRYYNYHYTNFKLWEDTKAAYEFVILRYDKEPSTDDWKIINDSNLPTEYLHNEKSTLEINTMLINSVEAENLAAFYINLIKDPPDKINVKLPPEALNTLPADKSYFTRSIVDMQGDTVTILDEELFLIIKARKNIKDGSIDIEAILDSQATGTGGHANIPHGDEHEDDNIPTHDDTAHVDSAHGDSAHNDVPHSDHDDFTHDDFHDDFHGDHDDEPVHTDTHDDSHLDESHEDHGDSHTDTPHTDTEHTDTAHEDHDDSVHVDEHSDIPHTDSET